MGRLSVVIIARDEDVRLPACLASVRGVDEIVLVDDGSTDGTVACARRAGARVVPGSGPLGALRAQGQAHAGGDWILSLDADERLPPDGLAGVLAAVDAAAPDVAAFRLPVHTYLGDRLLRWGGYYPARRARLYRAERGTWPVAARVHERLRVTGRVRRLDVPLEHRSFRDLAHAREKYLRYAEWAAAEWRAAGVRPTPWGGALRAAGRFLRVFVIRGGFLMGALGWRLACLQALAVWHRWRSARAPNIAYDPPVLTN